ncbi:aminoacyl-tRNA hydrolase [Thermodesulforhabdus norvegica]|uniref:Peptidyl-tRNA hydrolase n=1 Tax=Thermodesulforhabdus norvegica TaxID=39841 RepID=A0A1I4UR11_9BACT|nr:aminoacyl-tRNA hydrolase [Thermodesulforhabdus norvegica]SFM91419.1 peptidyl-tRNA hydrolase [Thermodesulforhabdus norvegica]
MWLIVGLGNPGPEYSFTRHNVGFLVVDLLVDRLTLRQEFKMPWGIVKKCLCKCGEIAIVKPVTYMNRSGIAVKEALRLLDVNPLDELVVVHDDLDLPLGRLKVVRKGSSGGHRGVQSVIDSLGTNEFGRVKIGIGRPLYGESVYEYVLSPPYGEEEKKFCEMIEKGVEALEVIVSRGFDEAMNRFNGRVW